VLSTATRLRIRPYTPNEIGSSTASQVKVPDAANGIATPTATSASAG